MPTINVTGNSGRDPLQGTPEERANANWENSNENSKSAAAARDIRDTKANEDSKLRHRDRQSREESRAADREFRDTVGDENQKYRYRERNRRAGERAQDREFRDTVSEENQKYRFRARNRRVDERSQDREFRDTVSEENQKYRFRERNRRTTQRADDREFRDTVSEENQKYRYRQRLKRTTDRSEDREFRDTVSEENQKYRYRQRLKRTADRDDDQEFRFTVGDENQKYKARQKQAKADERGQDQEYRFTVSDENQKYKARQKQAKLDQRGQDQEFRATVAEENQKWRFRQKEAAERARAAGRTQANAAREAALSDPETYFQRGIAGIGSRGASAALSGKYQDMRDASGQLDRLERRTQRAMKGATGTHKDALTARLASVRQARAQVAGSSGLAEEAGLMGLAEGAAPIVAGAMAAYGIAKSVVTAPWQAQSTAEGIQSAARPFVNLRYAGADQGRANNFEGEGLLREFTPGGAVPEWMQRLGLSPTEAMRIAGSTGLPYANAHTAAMTVKDVAEANRMPGLAGLGTDRLGQSLNTARTLGVDFHGGWAGDSLSMRGRMDTRDGNNSAYFKMLADATSRGTSMGLDRSQTLSGIEGLWRQAATAGATTVNASGLADSYLRMASTGSAGARTGEMQASVQAGYHDAISGLGIGGDPAQAMVLESRIGQTGGLPKDRASLAKFLHMSEADLSKYEETDSGHGVVERTLAASNAGNHMAFGENLKPLLDSNTDNYRKLVDESDQVRSVPDYIRNTAGGILVHSSTQKYADSSLQSRTTALREAPVEVRALLDTIGAKEGSYDSLYGDSAKRPRKFTDFSQFPTNDGGVGPDGRSTHPAGRYQFEPGTWRRAATALGLKDFSPESQDRAAAWLAKDTYEHDSTREHKVIPGRNLEEDLKDPSKRQGVMDSLRSQWPSLFGGSQSNGRTEDGQSGEYNRALNREGVSPAEGVQAKNDTSGESIADALVAGSGMKLSETANVANTGLSGGETGGAMVALSDGALKAATSIGTLKDAVDETVKYLRGMKGNDSTWSRSLNYQMPRIAPDDPGQNSGLPTMN